MQSVESSPASCGEVGLAGCAGPLFRLARGKRLEAMATCLAQSNFMVPTSVGQDFGVLLAGQLVMVLNERPLWKWLQALRKRRR
jgi:hypothetical protein